MGKIGLLVLVVAVVGAVVAEDAVVEKNLETRTETKQENVAVSKLEQSDNNAEDRRAYNTPLVYGQQPYAVPQANPNAAARAQANAGANGYAQPAYNAYPTTSSPLPNILVTCYNCVDCPHVTKDTPTKMCPLSFDPNKSGKCISYAAKYVNSKKKYYVRGCASDLGTCEDVKNSVNKYPDAGNLIHCSSCGTNQCNAGEIARSLPAFGIASLALVIIPLLKNKLLS